MRYTSNNLPAIALNKPHTNGLQPHLNNELSFAGDRQVGVHLFIDANIGLFFLAPVAPATEGSNYVQRAVLIQAHLNLLCGNIEEAGIGFNNALRFGQVNQDALTISHSLLHLIYVSRVKEDYRAAVGYLENLLSLANVDPYCTLIGYLAYLELEAEIDVGAYKSELKGAGGQLNEVEALHHTLKQLLAQAEETYFEKGVRRSVSVRDSKRIDSLINARFLNILAASGVNNANVLFDKLDISLLDADAGIKAVWRYIVHVSLQDARR